MQRLSTARKQSTRTRLEHGRALWLAKRAGLGISGALNGAITAAYLADAGVSFFHPVVLAAALMIFGWGGAFVGVTIEPWIAAGRKPVCGTKTTHPSEVLSTGGTFSCRSICRFGA